MAAVPISVTFLLACLVVAINHATTHAHEHAHEHAHDHRPPAATSQTKQRRADLAVAISLVVGLVRIRASSDCQ